VTVKHPLLLRHLRRLGLDESVAPDATTWALLLERLERSFEGFDEDRYTIERAFESSSAEMKDLYARLELASARQIEAGRDELARSLAILEATVESVEDAILVVGNDETVLLCNGRFRALFGLGPEHLQRGQRATFLRQVFAGLEDPSLGEAFVASVENRPLASRRAEVVLRDGRHLTIFRNPVSSEGKLIGRMWTLRDETARLAREAEVRDANRFLHSIVENLPDMVFVKDAESLRCVRLNHAGERLLGVGRDDVIGRTTLGFSTGPGPRSEMSEMTEMERDAQVIASGNRETGEELLLTAGQGKRNVFAARIPIYDDSGKARYLLGIARDVTELNRQRVELEQTRDAAERASRAKSTFLSSMSHELRTPLNGILGFGEVLVRGALGPLNEQQREGVEEILRAGERMTQLVGELLELQRIGAGEEGATNANLIGGLATTDTENDPQDRDSDAAEGWSYLAAPNAESIRTLIASWKSLDPTLGVFALVAETDRRCIPPLQTVSRELEVELVGGIVPEVIVAGGMKGHGVLLIKLRVMPPTAFIEHLGDSAQSERHAVEALEALALQAVGMPDRANLFLLFDGRLDNVGSLLGQLHAAVGDLVTYSGIGCGSDALLPGPCVFTGRLTVNRAVLAMLLPGDIEVAMAHGYTSQSERVFASAGHGNLVTHLDWLPAFEQYRMILRAHDGTELDRNTMRETATRFPLLFVRGDGETIVRVPIAVDTNGALLCVGQVPAGCGVAIAKPPEITDHSVTEVIRAALGTSCALVFQGLGRRAYLGRPGAERELARLACSCGAELIGAVTLGEIGSTVAGGLSVLHTSTLCAMPWMVGTRRTH